jgi:hypothetical protein
MTMHCLKPFDGLFEMKGITLIDHRSSQPAPKSAVTTRRMALFGGADAGPAKEPSVPNSWMASPTSHPFFLLMLKWLNERFMTGEGGSMRENLTGSVALFRAIEAYRAAKSKDSGYHGLHDHLNENSYVGPKGIEKAGLLVAPHEVEVLPSQYIHLCVGKEDHDGGIMEVCKVENTTFGAALCQLACGVRSPLINYAISYLWLL